ncbi:methylated-DNA--[protein]-cysteine S-methyltransferase [Kutzneria albida]|uniref:Methylated-DNA-(Protein)-cysteine S-methyltransferase n=1 Tax=Kutzneria albida DSM 43870 TaxID=1449976 RepID=W5W4D4_9PSEU|nr:methylated-DNA--[protein]-cysteine S-methyltransferase [Kutzneria albida]AHH96103.1 methylated-DNA-(protein)-cysteine S-methyltransferase [Kutzneria albida DSM 43870]
MTTNGSDPLARALGELLAAPPTSLVDRVFSRWIRVPGPIGELYVASTDRGIDCVLPAECAPGGSAEFLAHYRDLRGRPLLPAERPPAGLLPALRKGSARSLRFDLDGLSQFDREVLAVVLRIPSGQTRPYSWVAREVGRPSAVRAVGSALVRNPVPVLVPCHRVTRVGGVLGEYVFGTPMKESLLRAENLDLEEVRSLARARVHFLGSDTTGIVCFPTCHHARRITAPHRRGFRSVEQAADAGYRPCRHCRPGPVDQPA